MGVVSKLMDFVFKMVGVVSIMMGLRLSVAVAAAGGGSAGARPDL